MALINCWECDATISTTAEACPKCGAPSKHVNSVAQDLQPVVQTIGIDPEVHKEMLAQASITVKRKKLLKNLQDIVAGTVHEKFLNAKGNGKKVYAQIQWKHYFIDDHEKDKTTQTHVSKTTGFTNRGNSYVKDVNVSTTTTHYDYVDVIDTKDHKSTYRLVDCQLDKLKAGQVISLGWVNKSEQPLVDEQCSEDSGPIGQSWGENIQPSIFVSHLDPKGGSESNWQALASEEFNDSFISSSIGKWHLLWLTPVVLSVANFQEELLISGSVIALSAMIVVKVARSIKAGKQFKLFKEWYRNEASQMLHKGNDSYERLR
ncbi:hypothetical protein FGD67_08270 [Colwellia sp. M166]|uniref:DUF2703 domain-containing protein n=1 Tax=Colwellia sp. M166 TaxID=2583805 RepID=UPI00211E4461|nr:DUF2703 domain-containing protein [Colwellia sp. M166]UUO23208.1 hypothetical protein FGD67_08270 [Colwellia sp. M166]|tara:strand:+ start:18 stop:971 length:954 start_codon:yes stop_codon:yes gene_type:complete